MLQRNQVSLVAVVLPMELPTTMWPCKSSRPGERTKDFTWRRSTLALCMRSRRSCTAASTTARVGFDWRKTHHLVAQKMLPGLVEEFLNWPCRWRLEMTWYAVMTADVRIAAQNSRSDRLSNRFA